MTYRLLVDTWVAGNGRGMLRKGEAESIEDGPNLSPFLFLGPVELDAFRLRIASSAARSYWPTETPADAVSRVSESPGAERSRIERLALPRGNGDHFST